MPASPRFPPISSATDDGLLMLGGRLEPEWLLEAYRNGIFPWPIVEGRRETLAWYSPDPRAVIELDALHVSRRLRRRLRSGQFRITTDVAFSDVMAACAKPRRNFGGVWITPRLRDAYLRMHALGHAHSVDVWQAERLVGGLYGMSLGGYFAAESMFHHERDASKAALAALVDRLRRRGFRLLDVQVSTPHVARLGATEIPRSDFLRRLREALAAPGEFGASDEIDVAQLTGRLSS
jgi:leucyl/phenylalanyl-tRNA--protein transferase